MAAQITIEAFAALGAPNLVYVRPIPAEEILDGAPDDEFEISPEQILYALYGANGERLAVLIDRESAIATALAYDLAPVAVN